MGLKPVVKIKATLGSKGDKGDTGDTGAKGDKGDDGGITADHAAFNNLDFSSSGHAGFAAALTADQNYVSDAQLAALHSAISLDANADTLLSLSTQELGLDTQVANKVFGGPATGGDAVPTFRSLVAADIAANLINDTHIDWGTGTNQVSSCDIPDHNGHTVRDTFVHIVNRGVAEAITITLTGGLNFSWTAGEIYDIANHTFVAIEAGSGSVTNTAVNYLKWVSGTTLTISTSDATGNEVLIAIGTVYDGNINGYREMSLLDESLANIRRCARAVFPTRVTSGMSVHEDADATNPLDVTMDAGVYCKEIQERITPVEIKSRNTAMVRNFHTGGVWDSDTNAQIETTNYDNGTQKTAIPGGKYVKGLFIYMNGKIGFVYPTEYFNTIAQAQDAALPTMPTGLEPVPKLTAIVYQQGAVNFTNAVWQDVRAGISEESFSGVTDHGALAGLGDDDHPQYIKDSEFTQNSGILVGTGAGTFAEETGATLRTSIGCAAIDQTMYIGTTAVAINRGTGALTLAGITLTTPDIGTPSAGTLTNCSFPTLNQNTTGSSGSCTGNSATVTNATLTTALTVNTGTVTLTGNVANSSVLTVGAGAVSVSGANTGDQTTVSGNAGSATVLETARNINGVSFNGSANITVTADANTLSNTVLKSTVVTSSLTALGTIATGVWEATDVAVAHGGTGASTASAAASNLGLGTEDSPTFTGLTVSANITMGDNSVTGVNTITFTDTAGTIAGIANGNLLDKTATEAITGLNWTFRSLASDNELAYINYSNSVSNESLFAFKTSHQNTVGHTATIDTERLGGFSFYGSTASNFAFAARVRAVQDGAIGTLTPAHMLFEVSNGSSVIQALKIEKDGDAYFIGDVSVLSLTDRTPFYEGNAIEEIKNIKGKKGKIDHTTLPKFARRKAKNKKGKDGRDLGAMISILTVAVQQLTNRLEILENK